MGADDAPALAERWRALPDAARWSAYALACVVACAALALAGWLRFGDALFWTGAAFVLLSASHIRLGGPRTRVALRDLQGEPVARAKVPKTERDAEIARGWRLFALGVALWAASLATAFL